MTKPVVYYWPDTKRLRDGADHFFEVIAKNWGADDSECPRIPNADSVAPINTAFSSPVAIKLSFGEEGNNGHVNPAWLANLPKFFPRAAFVECNALYAGSRTRKKDHEALARVHGYTFLPVDILDGEAGEKEDLIPVNKGLTKQARLGAGLAKYPNGIAVSHFKGHMAAGFGGALKNIGMGLGSRAGKLDMHGGAAPRVDEEKCVSCGACIKHCGVQAIAFNANKKAHIDPDKCVHCAGCIEVCPQAAVQVPWEAQTPGRLQEKIAEYALAAMKNRRWAFVSFLTHITKHCDCITGPQTPFMPDLGVLYSLDPVAIDQAGLELVKKANKGVYPFQNHFGIDNQHQVDYAEKIGLGTKEYELVTI